MTKWAAGLKKTDHGQKDPCRSIYGNIALNVLATSIDIRLQNHTQKLLAISKKFAYLSRRDTERQREKLTF